MGDSYLCGGVLKVHCKQFLKHDSLERFESSQWVASKRESISYWRISRPNVGSLPMVGVAVHEKCYWNGKSSKSWNFWHEL